MNTNTFTDKLEIYKITPKVAEVINHRSHYYGEEVYLTNICEIDGITWYLSSIVTRDGFKVYFKDSELEILC